MTTSTTSNVVVVVVVVVAAVAAVVVVVDRWRDQPLCLGRGRVSWSTCVSLCSCRSSPYRIWRIYEPSSEPSQ